MKKLGLLVVFVIARTAQAQPAPPPPTAPGGGGGDVGTSANFGDRGHIVITGAASVAFEYISVSPPSGSMSSSASSTTVIFEPELDYFVAPNISIGGGVEYLHESIGSGGMTAVTESAYGLIARAGYHLPLGPQIGLWLRGGFGYASATFDPGGGNPTSSSSVLQLEISAPLMFHPVPHFFVGIGPILSTDLSSSVSSGGMSMDSNKRTVFGLTSMIGGWL